MKEERIPLENITGRETEGLSDLIPYPKLNSLTLEKNTLFMAIATNKGQEKGGQSSDKGGLAFFNGLNG